MANEAKITVLFVNPSSGLSGDTQSLGNLLQSLGEAINPIVLLTSKGVAYDFFVDRGIECFVHPYLTEIVPVFSWSQFLTLFFHPWRFRFFKLLIYHIPCFHYVRKSLKGRIPDIIHTNTAPTRIGLQLSKIYKTSHVWHVREQIDINQTGCGIFMGRDYLRSMINKSQARVVVSNSCQRFWRLKEENTFVIYDAVRRIEDCCYERVKQPYVLFCSNAITKVKGIVMAIHAFGLSGLAIAGIRMKVVGHCSSDDKETLMKLAMKYDCADSIDFLPFQEDVKPLFAYAMAFIQPSVNEGMGRTTAEAMFFGCPVVALASGGTMDLVRDGETGYLFETVEECAELLKKVCTKDQETIILKAQEFAIQNLSVEVYGNKIMEVYRSVLDDKNGSKIK